MRSFSLGRNAKSSRSVSRQTGRSVERGFDHPVGMILFDGRFDGSLEPFFVEIHLVSVELVENLKSQVGEEWRLRPGEIVGSVTVEHLVVVLDLKDAVFDDAHGEVDFAIDKETQCHEILSSTQIRLVSLTLSHPYFSLNRAPGTIKGTASSLPFFSSMARARIPGASFNVLTNAGSSQLGGSVMTWRFRLGLAIALS